jgi:hypothetical protein
MSTGATGKLVQSVDGYADVQGIPPLASMMTLIQAYEVISLKIQFGLKETLTYNSVLVYINPYGIGTTSTTETANLNQVNCQSLKKYNGLIQVPISSHLRRAGLPFLYTGSGTPDVKPLIVVYLDGATSTVYGVMTLTYLVRVIGLRAA